MKKYVNKNILSKKELETKHAKSYLELFNVFDINVLG